jgi:eukaryotic-like serine/threonine-protein kinase
MSGLGHSDVDFDAMTPSCPAQLGRYAIGDEIARGGMGVIYRATDTVLGREVAVKLLQHRFDAASAAARRFVDEARITGQLQHPGIPAIHDLGTFPDGRPFLAMKLIKGRTLQELLNDRGGPGSFNLIAVFEQVCQAVGYAHAHGVIHRDLKPANVMIGAFGEVQVMDWGLAKVLMAGDGTPRRRDEDPDATIGTEIRSIREADAGTQAGSMLGTPAFMPPEQAIGAIDQIDQRSDVFGLGAVLCTILTGKPPYIGADTESTRQLAARAKLDDAFARLDACGAEPDFVALCKRCLSPEKSDRPADAGVVAKAVADLRAAADERARRAELERVRAEGERAKAEAETREQRKRRRVQLALAATVALLVAGGVAFGWYQDRQARDERLSRTADAVATLLLQCEDALRADNAYDAQRTLEQAEKWAAEGGTDDLVDRFARCRTDLAMLRELDDIDTFRSFVVDNKLPDAKEVAARWKTAFAGYGVKPGETQSSESSARITVSLIRERLIATLDLWLVFDPSATVREILAEADANPYRDAIREATVVRDRKRVADLADQPEALSQPAGFTAALGQHRGAIPGQRRREVLEAALRARPGNLSLLIALGGSYPINQRQGADERLRWHQAAVAAHPRSALAHNSLGIALSDKGAWDAAILAYRDVVRLDPNNAAGHNNLGNALKRTGDLDRAIAAYKEAIRLNPDRATISHTNLGTALRDKNDLDGAITSFKDALRIEPKHESAHYHLMAALKAKGGLDGAIAACQEAIRFNPQDAAAYHDLGNALRDKKDLDGAIDAYKKAIQLDAKFVLARANLGLAWKEKGDLDEAIAAYWAAIRVDPNNEGVYLRLRQCYVAKGDPDGAVKAAQEAVLLFPTASLAHHCLGDAFQFDKKDAQAAVPAYKKAISLNPIHAYSHNNLGTALRSTGDLDGAIVAFQEALRLEPRFGQAHHNLRTALRAKGGPDAALAEYREAVRFNPDDATAHAWLAEALRDKKELDAAIAEAKEAIRLDPKIALAHAALAHALHDKKNLDAAIAAYHKALELDPNHGFRRLRLGMALKDKGDLDGAIAAFRRVIEVAGDPNRATAQANLGHALRAKGDLDGAIAAYWDVIRSNPRSQEALNNLLRLYADKGDPDGAVTAAQEAIRLFPNAFLTHHALGDALQFHKKDSMAAIPAYKKAIRLNPNHAWSHHNLGLALRSTGNLNGAIESLREAVRLDPRFGAARRQLAKTLEDKNDLAAAVAVYQGAIERSPKDWSLHFDLANVLAANKDLDGAIAAYKEAVRLNPKNGWAHSALGETLRNKKDLKGAMAAHEAALRLEPKNSVFVARLGHALLNKKELDKAIAAYRDAIRLAPSQHHPGVPHWYSCLGRALKDKGDLDGAVVALREAVRLAPKGAHVRELFVEALKQKGDLLGAVESLGEAVRLTPDNGQLHSLLARLLATGPDGVRDGKRAVELATRACELCKWKFPGRLDTLAAAYAEIGDFDQAVTYQKKALAASHPEWEKGEGKDARQRLELYTQQRPYRDPAVVLRQPPPQLKPASTVP